MFRRSATRLVAVSTARVLAGASIVLCLVLSGCSPIATRQGLGSHEADLESIESALDTTITEAHLHVLSRSPGLSDNPCLGSSDHTAGQSMVVDLDGESAVEVSHRIADVWQQHADQWMGGGLLVDRSQADIADFARVTAQKGGWDLEAAVPMNKDLGPYIIKAGGPCY
jgi:hypothetical protein